MPHRDRFYGWVCGRRGISVVSDRAAVVVLSRVYIYIRVLCSPIISVCAPYIKKNNKKSFSPSLFSRGMDEREKK